MNRYVKKSIEIEAVKWEGFNNDEIKDFAGDNVKIEVIREGDADSIYHVQLHRILNHISSTLVWFIILLI